MANVTSVLVLISPVMVGVVMVGDVSVLLVNTSVPAKVDKVPVIGRVTFVAAVEVSVIENAPDVAKVLLLAIVSTPEVVALMVRPLIVVVIVSPVRVGADMVGEVANTKPPPLPVSSEMMLKSCALVVAALF